MRVSEYSAHNELVACNARAQAIRERNANMRALRALRKVDSMRVTIRCMGVLALFAVVFALASIVETLS